MTDYRIIRVSTSIADLEALVKLAAQDDWQPSGAPQWSTETREWYQAVWKQKHAAPEGSVPLREPKRRT